MSKYYFKNYTFENAVLSFQTYNYEFTPELYDDFDSKSKQMHLQTKIDDLFAGKKVNISSYL